MKHRLRLRSDVEEEIGAAAKWYESESEGLGSRFLDEVKSTLNRITNSPLTYQIIRKYTRRSKLRHFPYVLFFLVNENEIVITGLRHTSRHPRTWPSE